MQPNYAESIGFLNMIHPSGWWTLSAIPVEGIPGEKRVASRTFRAGDGQSVNAWLTKLGKDHNIYFHVAGTDRPLNNRLKRTDVHHVGWLHVDVDPRNGQDLKTEQARILEDIMNARGLPKPTCVLFSGGGYQAFWKLREAIAVEGSIDLANEAGRYNQKISQLVGGGDSCHSVDHLMRLPGTLNRPDEKKKAKGRVTALAEVVHCDESAVYGIDQFTKAPSVQIGDGALSAPRLVNIPGNIPRIKDVTEIPGNVSEAARAAIVTGEHPDDDRKHESRSEVLWWVVCEMVRADVPDEIIYSVITDPDFAISESVIEKGSGKHRYAMKQINSAKEKAIAPELAEMNGKYAAVMNYGGFCVVYEQEDRSMNRTVLKRITQGDLTNYLQNRTVVTEVKDDGTVKTEQLGKWWLRHPNRRQYLGIIFDPSIEGSPEGYYNLWQGYGVEAIHGTGHEAYLSHLKDNVCRGNEDHYRYLIGWMANAVQNPGEPGHSAVVLRGGRGTGKSVAVKIFGRLFGRHYLTVTNSSHLVGNFNAHLRDCVLLFGDEAFYAGDKKHESVLKTLVTEEQQAIEAKGIDVEMQRNCVHLMMASNDKWVVPSGRDERRFFVLDVGDDHRRDTTYFSRILGQMEDGGYSNLLQFLLDYDLSDFNVRNVPGTEALEEQKDFSAPPEEQWWKLRLHDGAVVDGHDSWKDTIYRNVVYDDYLEYVRKAGRGKRLSMSEFLRFLGQVCPTFKESRVRGAIEYEDPRGNTTTVDRPRMAFFPDLSHAREAYDKFTGTPGNWPEEDLDRATLPQEKEPPF